MTCLDGLKTWFLSRCLAAQPSIFRETGFFCQPFSGYNIVSGRSTKIQLVGSEDLSFHYLPDRAYFTALLDIRGFLP
ncbi:hypothetical protein D0A37_13980 [Microcoleus vaginatus HSN003]|nr:hypothetical protein D0A37_13980 [Microcoleus vaginatus HSN003]